MTFAYSIDHWFTASYDDVLYHCGHFTADVWQEMTGQDIRAALGVLLGPAAGRKVKKRHRAAFLELPQPVSPCLALMQRPKAAAHIGVYFEGRILHIRGRAVEWQPPEVASRGFEQVTYYKCKP